MSGNTAGDRALPGGAGHHLGILRPATGLRSAARHVAFGARRGLGDGASQDRARQGILRGVTIAESCGPGAQGWILSQIGNPALAAGTKGSAERSRAACVVRQIHEPPAAPPGITGVIVHDSSSAGVRNGIPASGAHREQRPLGRAPSDSQRRAAIASTWRLDHLEKRRITDYG